MFTRHSPFEDIDLFIIIVVNKDDKNENVI